MFPTNAKSSLLPNSLLLLLLLPLLVATVVPVVDKEIVGKEVVTDVKGNGAQHTFILEL